MVRQKSRTEKEQIVRLYGIHKNQKKVASLARCAEQTVKKVLEDEGIYILSKKEQTQIKKQQILSCYLEFSALEEISKQFNLSKALISEAIKEAGLWDAWQENVYKKKHSHLIGQVFEDLTVTKVADKKNRQVAYVCKCKCGRSDIFTKRNLIDRVSKSCAYCGPRKRKRKRPIIELTTGKRYDSLFQAMRELGLRSNQIYTSIHTGRSTKGFKFDWDS